MIDTSASHSPAWQIVLSFMLIAAVGSSLVAVPGLDGLLGGLLACIMLAIAVVDGRRYLVPNELTAAAAAIGLLRAGITSEDAGVIGLVQAGLSAAATALPFLAMMKGYRAWRGRDGLGLGDVKLAAVAGIWLGWVTIFEVTELATLAALGAYLLSGFIRKRALNAKAMLPFGLFFAPAIWFGWLLESFAR